MTTQTITVPEIHCEHCKTSIEGALGPMDGVHDARVDIDNRQVTVEYDESVVNRVALVGTIEAQGFDVPAQG